MPNTVTDVSVGIEVHTRDVLATSALLAKQSQALLDYLRAEQSERLRTGQVDVEPEIQEVRGQPGRITGYIGQVTVSFRKTSDRAPVLLAGCLDHGANSLQQSGSSPREEEVDKARDELAAEAARSALAQAEAVAQAVGVELANIQPIDLDGAEPGPIRPMMVASKLARVASASAPIPIVAGEAVVSMGVHVRVGLAPRP